MSQGSSKESPRSRTWRRFAADMIQSFLRRPRATAIGPAVVYEDDADDPLLDQLLDSFLGFGFQLSKESIRASLIETGPEVEEVLAMDHVAGDDGYFSSTVVVRLRDGRFAFLHENEENQYGFVTDSEIGCAAHALAYASDDEFGEKFEAILAGPFDRSLDGWMDVAADWWDEQGEDFVASELRQVAESRRYRKATEGMTLEQRIAYRESLDK